MKANLLAGFAGLMFGCGLAISGMGDGNKVVGVLDVVGNWDPSLGFVMVGAIGIFMPFYHRIIRSSAPIFDTTYHLPASKVIDLRLLGGASLFGAGWALSGLCPGPAIIALMSMSAEMVVFFSTMLGGMLVQHYLEAVSVSRIVSGLSRST